MNSVTGDSSKKNNRRRGQRNRKRPKREAATAYSTTSTTTTTTVSAPVNKISALLPKTSMHFPKDHLGMTDFTGYTSNFKGYKCRFLKKEFQIMIKLNIPQMAITQYDTLGLYEMDEIERQTLILQIDQLLAKWREFDVAVVNPFRYRFNSEGLLQHLYVRLSSECAYFKKNLAGKLESLMRADRPRTGIRFGGRVAILIKGVKYSQDGFELTPIMVVAQILEIEERKPVLPSLQTLQRTCMLDNDSTVDSTEPISLENYLKQMDEQVSYSAAAGAGGTENSDADDSAIINDLFI